MGTLSQVTKFGEKGHILSILIFFMEQYVEFKGKYSETFDKHL